MIAFRRECQCLASQRTVISSQSELQELSRDHAGWMRAKVRAIRNTECVCRSAELRESPAVQRCGQRQEVDPQSCGNAFRAVSDTFSAGEEVVTFDRGCYKFAGVDGVIGFQAKDDGLRREYGTRRERV
jgi:hypothetical protein